jgi:hypothetical protein
LLLHWAELLTEGEQVSLFLRRPLDPDFSTTSATSLLDVAALSSQDGELSHLSGTTAESERFLGWRAQIPLREGLRRTIEWHKREALKWRVKM